ncbi:carbohydrate kinase family protein [Cellulomonas sp. URHE0023]|uniref:carbohydrate kinase family protein n=1 Tax=Cellulomonas sp. URHE0023 TaxID=1380354 RepID=UPI000484BA9F|nr:carbohydrate kinase family protein [Cellulomonas sp. URHE0023]
MTHVLINGPASWNTLVRLPALPAPVSHTLFASSHDDGLGGTSAGKAVTLAALGVDVTLRTVLGDDAFGTQVRAALDHPRIDLVAQPASAGRTERHVNLMADDGARLSIYLELPTAAPGPAPSFDGVDVAVLDLADHSRPLLTAARAAGVPVWCDVHDDDGAAAYPRDFAVAADVLLVSAARLTDRRAYLADAVARGCRLAVCTDGAEGALALDADGWISVGTADATVIDTNGAGDAFLAGLLSAVLDGLPTTTALAHAAATGALAVGTRSLGAPHATRDDVARLAAGVPVRRH